MSEKGQNIIIVGFSFTGKSLVGEKTARKLGFKRIDSDHEIAKLAGKPIPDIFAEDGEEHFRNMERQVLEKACAESGAVISTGGGAMVDPRNRELFAKSGAVVCLESTPHTIYKRLVTAQKGDSVVRPLLAVDDPLGRITQLKASRQAYYATADWAIYTDNMSIEEVVDEVIRGFEEVRSQQDDSTGGSLVVTTPTQSYPIFVGWGILDHLGRRMRQVGLSGQASIISDENVYAHHGARASKALESTGFHVESFLVPPGETTKTIDTAISLYDWLVARRSERWHAIVALGGGMVGDLAGFVAATFLRGLPLVQVPTSLMAMADSSIGGKVGVNHPQAKNIIGAFYQPCLVMSDVSTLATLPQRELTSGWAEVLKHGLILDADFVDSLEANAEKLMKLEAEATTEAIRRSAGIKAEVVGEDERERERRMVLNYGHTIAHGLETATDYERLLHGEAVAIGMAGAAMLSQRMGLIPDDTVARQSKLIQRFGLPISCTDVDRNEVLKAMELDKKIREKTVRWVLLEDIGETVFRSDVSPDDVNGVLGELVTD